MAYKILNLRTGEYFQTEAVAGLFDDDSPVDEVYESIDEAEKALEYYILGANKIRSIRQMFYNDSNFKAYKSDFSIPIKELREYFDIIETNDKPNTIYQNMLATRDNITVNLLPGKKKI